MADIIDVQTKELTKKATKMQKSLDEAVNQINSIYNDNLYKVGDIWKSKESHDYINNLADYLNDLKQLVDTYKNYIAFLKTASDQYGKALDQNISTASKC